MAYNERTRGSVRNIKRAMKDGAAGRRERAGDVADRTRGTVATRLTRLNRKRGLR